MRFIRRLRTLIHITFISSVLLGMTAFNAYAAQVWTFDGQCNSACNSGFTTGVLTLTDAYVPGSVLTIAVFESFTLNIATIGSYSAPPLNLTSVSGALPDLNPFGGEADVSLGFNGGVSFQTFTGPGTPNWTTTFEPCDPCVGNFEWQWQGPTQSAVPVPSSMLLLGTAY